MTTFDRTHAPTEPTPHTEPASPVQHRRGGAVLAAGGLTLVAGLLVVPGPFVADVGDATWVPGHALNVVGYLLLVVGLPALAGSLGPRLRWPGAIGYAALMVRFALSSGSHLYSMWLMPRLARYPELHTALTRPHPLANIYGGHNDAINVVLAVGMLGMVWTLWRTPGRLRAAAVVLLAAAVLQALSNPVALLLYGVLALWLGLRLAVRGRLETALFAR